MITLRRHLLKPNRKNKMVIKVASRQSRPKLPTSKRPSQLIYEVVKYASKYFGIYNEIKQYDPGYYYERYYKQYAYKPRKRITGYAFQTKGFLQRRKTYGKFRKAFAFSHYRSHLDECRNNNSQSGYCSFQYY